jgi:hypothetical protein
MGSEECASGVQRIANGLIPLVFGASIAIGTWAHQQGFIGDSMYYIATATLFLSLVFTVTERAFEGLIGGIGDE